MQDNKYIEGLLRGDDKMLRAIYKNFSGRISNYVIKNGGSKEDAKDIFQDALMIILQKAQSPDFELTSSFYTYLYSVCKLVFYGKRRKKTNQTVTIPEDNTLKDTYSIEQELINRELDKVYRDNFSKLGLLCQQLLKLFFNKKNMTEIAQQLDLKNEHTARTRKYRCRESLKKKMEADDRFIELKQS